MKHGMRWTRSLLAAAMLAMSGAALSQPYGYGPGMMGPGMGPGMGSGMMGPGMMGPGMMGPGMMGQGMMGPGMMGPGMGPGMMYNWLPDLTDAQRGQIAKIQEEFRTKQTEFALKLNEEQARLQSLWLADKREPAQVREQHRKIYDLKRQMMDAMYDVHLKLDGVLTKEQRERMWRQGWRAWR